MAAKQPKLQEHEVSLIKGLHLHTALNDQAITAIFSHRSRNVNQREIGAVRKDAKKYQGIAPASKNQAEEFLRRYDRFELVAKRFGLAPFSASDALAERAASIMKVAVGVYNNPTVTFRSDIFLVNAIMAWTYILHAYFNKNDIPYVYEKDGEPVLVDGESKLFDLAACLGSKACPLDKGVINNLRFLLLLRNAVEHRAAEDISVHIQAKVQACALNISDFCVKEFGEAFSPAPDLGFAIQFAQITLQTHSELAGKDLPESISYAHEHFEKGLTSDEYNDPKYAYRVYIIPRAVNNPKKADQAVKFEKPNSAIAMAVKQVERKKYLAKDIVEIMKADGFHDFKTHNFVDFWKSVDGKNPAKGLYVTLGGLSFWYEDMVDLVRAHLKAKVNEP